METKVKKKLQIKRHRKAGVQGESSPLVSPTLQDEGECSLRRSSRLSTKVPIKDPSLPRNVNRRPQIKPELASSSSNMGDENEKEQEEEVASSSHVLPYIEVKLPDGRTVRTCCASDKCTGSEKFIEKWKRMMAHLREKHGLTIDIPCRPTGRPHGSKACPDNPNPHAKTWRRVALKRSKDFEYKWKSNSKRWIAKEYQKSQQAWDELRPQFKTVPKEEFIEEMTKPKVAKYMSTEVARKAKIALRARAKEKKPEEEANLNVDAKDGEVGNDEEEKCAEENDMHVGDVELPTADVELRHDAERPRDEELPTGDVELPRDEEFPTGDVQL